MMNFALRLGRGESSAEDDPFFNRRDTELYLLARVKEIARIHFLKHVILQVVASPHATKE